MLFHTEKKFAVLIDADNAQAKAIEAVLTVKRRVMELLLQNDVMAIGQTLILKAVKTF